MALEIQAAISDASTRIANMEASISSILAFQQMTLIPNAQAILHDKDLQNIFAFIIACREGHPDCKSVPKICFMHPKLQAIMRYVEKYNEMPNSEEDLKDEPEDPQPEIIIAWRLAIEFFYHKCPRMWSSGGYSRYASYFSGQHMLQHFKPEHRNLPVFKQSHASKSRFANVTTSATVFRQMMHYVKQQRIILDFTVIHPLPSFGNSRKVYSKNGARMLSKKRKIAAIGLLQRPAEKYFQITDHTQIPKTHRGYPVVTFQTFVTSIRNLRLH